MPFIKVEIEIPVLVEFDYQPHEPKTMFSPEVPEGAEITDIVPEVPKYGTPEHDALVSVLEELAIDAIHDENEEKAIAAAEHKLQEREFSRVYCSQCGGEFGPGNSGYSHCADHQGARRAG